jgi:hypothetical protein
MESINGSDMVKSNLPTGIVAILFSGWIFSVAAILLPPHFNSVIFAGLYTAPAAFYTGTSFLKNVRLVFFRKADSLTETHFGTGSTAATFSGVDMGQVSYSMFLFRVMFHKTSKKKSGV